MLLLLALTACTGTSVSDKADDTGAYADTDEPAPGEFALSLPAATPYTGDLADRCAWQLDVTYECERPSPEVRWEHPPDGTVAFALVLDDPDAADFGHWAVVNLPADVTSLGAGISGKDIPADLPGDAYQLDNGFGFNGYLGACPPEPHVYRWRLWALSAPLDTDLERFTQVENQAAAAALGEADTCHVYGPRSE